MRRWSVRASGIRRRRWTDGRRRSTALADAVVGESGFPDVTNASAAPKSASKWVVSSRVALVMVSSTVVVSDRCARTISMERVAIAVRSHASSILSAAAALHSARWGPTIAASIAGRAFNIALRA